MRKRGAEEEGKWSRVMRKRANDDKDENDENNEENEVKNEENEGGHEEEQEERGVLEEEANPEEDYLAEGFFY